MVAAALGVAGRWLAGHERYTSGDHATLTGLTQVGALRQLERLEREGFLIRGDEVGRNAHFVAGPRLSRLDHHPAAEGTAVWSDSAATVGESDGGAS